MKIYQENVVFSKHRRNLPGFASILTVISTGVALMIILMMIYDDTTQSQNIQKNNLLENDYAQREDAVLRALTNILPNKAILCMKDGSRTSFAGSCNWRKVFDESIQQANGKFAVNSATLTSFGIDSSVVSANTADKGNYNIKMVATSVKEPYSNYYVSEGTDRFFNNITAEYPPPLEFKPVKYKRSNTNWPVISNVKVYDPGVVTGWIDELSDDHQYGVLPSPSTFFKYGNNGKIIAKQNWWAFNLDFSKTSKIQTIDGNYKKLRKLRRRTSKEYIVSIYEIPSQLAINASTYALFGKFSNGDEWDSSKVSIEGGVFAEQVKTSGSFSVDSIASRKGVELNGVDAMASSDRDDALALGTAYAISSASDSGKVTFIPINRGLEFYDRFSVNDGKTVNFGYDNLGVAQNQYYSADGKTSGSTVSPTNWDYYSIGANQCVMNLVVTKVVSSDDQTPTEIEFTFRDGTQELTYTYTKDDPINVAQHIYRWDANDPLIPFSVGRTFENRPCLDISLEKLQTFLLTFGPSTPDINSSISVNVDYVNHPGLIKKPYRNGIVSGSDYDKDMSLRLNESKNLTNFKKGFSLVTNLRLIYADDLNTASFSSDPDDYPPLSVFSPEKVFGDTSYSADINIQGRINSLSKKNSSTEPVKILDLHSGKDNQVNQSNQTTLKGISNPAKLPPINLMNWMIVVKEKHD